MDLFQVVLSPNSNCIDLHVQQNEGSVNRVRNYCKMSIEEYGGPLTDGIRHTFANTMARCMVNCSNVNVMPTVDFLLPSYF